MPALGVVAMMFAFVFPVFYFTYFDKEANLKRKLNKKLKVEIEKVKEIATIKVVDLHCVIHWLNITLTFNNKPYDIIITVDWDDNNRKQYVMIVNGRLKKTSAKNDLFEGLIKHLILSNGFDLEYEVMNAIN